MLEALRKFFFPTLEEIIADDISHYMNALNQIEMLNGELTEEDRYTHFMAHRGLEAISFWKDMQGAQK